MEDDRAARSTQARDKGPKAASACLHNGVDIRALASFLGHHDPGFTLRTYVHLMPSADDRMRQAVDAVFASFDGPETARQRVR